MQELIVILQPDNSLIIVNDANIKEAKTKLTVLINKATNFDNTTDVRVLFQAESFDQTSDKLWNKISDNYQLNNIVYDAYENEIPTTILNVCNRRFGGKLSTLYICVKGLNDSGEIIRDAMVSCKVGGTLNFIVSPIDPTETQAIKDQLAKLNSKTIDLESNKLDKDFSREEQVTNVNREDLLVINVYNSATGKYEVKTTTADRLLSEANSEYKYTVQTYANLPTSEEIGTKVKVLFEDDGTTPRNEVFMWTVNGWESRGKQGDLTTITADLNALKNRVNTVEDTIDPFTTTDDNVTVDRDLTLEDGTTLKGDKAELNNIEVSGTSKISQVEADSIKIGEMDLSTKFTSLDTTNTSQNTKINELEAKVDVEKVSTAIDSAIKTSENKLPTTIDNRINNYRTNGYGGNSLQRPLELTNIKTSGSMVDTTTLYDIYNATVTRFLVGQRLLNFGVKTTGGAITNIDNDRRILELDRSKFTLDSSVNGVLKVGLTGDLGGGGSGGGDQLDYATVELAGDVTVPQGNAAETRLLFAWGGDSNRPDDTLITITSDGRFSVNGKAWFSLQDPRLVVQANSAASIDRTITIRCYKRAGETGTRELLGERRVIMPKTQFTTTPFIWNMETFADQSETTDTDIYDFTVFFVGQSADSLIFKVEGQNGTRSYANAFATVSKPVILGEYMKKSDYTADTLAWNGVGNDRVTNNDQSPVSHVLYASKTNPTKMSQSIVYEQDALFFTQQLIGLSDENNTTLPEQSWTDLDGKQTHRTLPNLFSANYRSFQSLKNYTMEVDARKIGKQEFKLKYNSDALINENQNLLLWQQAQIPLEQLVEQYKADRDFYKRAEMVIMQDGFTTTMPIFTGTEHKGALIYSTDTDQDIKFTTNTTVKLTFNSSYIDPNGDFEYDVNNNRLRYKGTDAISASIQATASNVYIIKSPKGQTVDVGQVANNNEFRLNLQLNIGGNVTEYWQTLQSGLETRAVPTTYVNMPQNAYIEGFIIPTVNADFTNFDYYILIDKRGLSITDTSAKRNEYYVMKSIHSKTAELANVATNVKDIRQNSTIIYGSYKSADEYNDDESVKTEQEIDYVPETLTVDDVKAYADGINDKVDNAQNDVDKLNEDLTSGAKIPLYTLNAIQITNAVGDVGYDGHINRNGRMAIYDKETGETYLGLDKRDVQGTGTLSNALTFTQTVYNKVDIETFQNTIITQYGAQVTYTTNRPVKLLFLTNNLSELKTYTLTISNANDSKMFILRDAGVLTAETIGGVVYQVINFNDTTFAFTSGTQIFSFDKAGEDISGIPTVNKVNEIGDARYAKSTTIREFKVSTTIPTVNDQSIITFVK